MPESHEDRLRRIVRPDPADGPLTRQVKAVLGEGLFGAEVVDLASYKREHFVETLNLEFEFYEPRLVVVSRGERMPHRKSSEANRLLPHLLDLIFKAHEATLSRWSLRVKGRRFSLKGIVADEATSGEWSDPVRFRFERRGEGWDLVLQRIDTEPVGHPSTGERVGEGR